MDPIGLEGGKNTFVYAAVNPLRWPDPLGLMTIGSWIKPPKLNVTDYGIDRWEAVSPSWSWWGFVQFIRVYGHASGFINIDVKCKSDCNEWEVHDQINIEAKGYFDFGPNVYAIIVGIRAGVAAGVGANVALGGAALLQAELHFLQLLNEKGMPIINAALAVGPTAICWGQSPW